MLRLRPRQGVEAELAEERDEVPRLRDAVHQVRIRGELELDVAVRIRDRRDPVRDEVQESSGDIREAVAARGSRSVERIQGGHRLPHVHPYIRQVKAAVRVQVHVHLVVSPRHGGVHDEQPDRPEQAGEDRGGMVPEMERPRQAHDRGGHGVPPGLKIREPPEGERARSEVEVLEVHVRVRRRRVLRLCRGAARTEELHRDPRGIPEEAAG